MIHLPLPTTKQNISLHYMASIHGSGMKDTGSLQANHIINDTGSLQANHINDTGSLQANHIINDAGSLQANHISRGGEENDRTEHGT